VRVEYSPESFSDTETDYALEVCEAVMDIWEPTPENKIILNLPDTVEWIPCNKHADQIEWFCRHMKNRELAIISVHTHNDRGTGVAAAEMGLMAGAERCEGTLFGNGERTGNLDLVTVALNRLADGIDPQLDFSDLPHIRSVYERVTRMSVPPRQPYSGDLVFTAFSGSHQDAIKKGMDLRKGQNDKDTPWAVPYLLIDPQDIGRTYESIVRINSQSGKGGVAHVMARDHEFELPRGMQPTLGQVINRVADEYGRELTSDEILQVFRTEFVDTKNPIELVKTVFSEGDEAGEEGSEERLRCHATIRVDGEERTIEGVGNGPISSFAHALEAQGWRNFKLTDFHEHAIGQGVDTEAVAYVQIQLDSGKQYWGAGVHTNIDLAGTRALVNAFNRSRTAKE
jgi:2-isopropylmalate synthase